jgi:hypothetical protein
MAEEEAVSIMLSGCFRPWDGGDPGCSVSDRDYAGAPAPINPGKLRTKRRGTVVSGTMGRRFAFGTNLTRAANGRLAIGIWRGCPVSSTYGKGMVQQKLLNLPPGTGYAGSPPLGVHPPA